MTRTIEAIFDGKVFRPSETVELEPDTYVVITITTKPKRRDRSFLQTARALKLDGPADWSENLDDSL